MQNITLEKRIAQLQKECEAKRERLLEIYTKIGRYTMDLELAQERLKVEKEGKEYYEAKGDADLVKIYKERLKETRKQIRYYKEVLETLKQNARKTDEEISNLAREMFSAKYSLKYGEAC